MGGVNLLIINIFFYKHDASIEFGMSKLAKWHYLIIFVMSWTNLEGLFGEILSYNSIDLLILCNIDLFFAFIGSLSYLWRTIFSFVCIADKGSNSVMTQISLKVALTLTFKWEYHLI